MSNDRQWLWTKVIAGLVSLFVLVSSCIGAANMHFDLKRDVVRNENSIISHKVDDEKEWDKAWDDIDDNSKAITLIQVQGARQETQNIEILRRLDELKATILRLEYNGEE
jgi:hypothetical protein